MDENMNSTVSLSSLEEDISAQFDVIRGPLAPLITSTTLYIFVAIITFIEYRSASSKLTNSNSNNHRGDDGAMDSRGRRVNRLSLKQHESSPSDGREGSNSPFTSRSSHSFKATGEVNRKHFYAYLLFSFIMRVICLPLFYIFTDVEQITSIVSWTLPTLSSALAYLILILFYAQVVATASGRSNPLDKYDGVIVKVSYITYAAIVALNCVIPVLSGKGNIRATLGCRLIMMSTICCVAFISRSVIYGWEAYAGIMGCEWFPGLMALLLMHQRHEEAPAVEHSHSNLMQLEAGIGMGVGVGVGQLSPLIDPIQPNVADGAAATSSGTGVKRSISVNAGRPSQNQQQRTVMHKSATASVGGRVMSRSMSSGRPAETKSLLRDKSDSAMTSTSNPISAYGAIHK
eukprot:scaffold2039_cov255-Chaetoceros_neogracile.AAC.3